MTRGKGTYIVLLYLPRLERVDPGRLGSFDFPPGYYCYAGSAQGPGGLEARLRRHVISPATRHWHIDYLRPLCDVVDVRAWEEPERLECSWASRLSTMPGASIPVPGFGSSDCRCRSHLIHFQERPDLSAFGSTADW